MIIVVATPTFTPDAWVGQIAAGGLRVAAILPGHSTLPADWGFRDRTLGTHVLYGVVRGKMLVSREGMERTLSEGGILWQMPDVRHTFVLAPGAGRTTLYHMRLVMTDSRGQPATVDRPWVVGRHAPGVLSYFEQLFADVVRTGANRDARVHARLTLLFAAIIESAGDEAAVPGLTDRQQAIVKSYVDARIGRRPTPTDLADAVNLSEEYFARLFKRTYGLAPRAWLVNERIRQASIALAETRSPIATIARKYGYEDQYLFSRQFRQVMSTSPREFRKRHA